MHELKGAERVCLSSVLPNRQVSGEGKEEKGDNGSGGTCVASTAMVRHPTEHAGRGANLIASSPKLVAVSDRRASPLVRAGRAHLGDGRRCYRQSGFSQTATSLLTSTWHDGTCKAYGGP